MALFSRRKKPEADTADTGPDTSGMVTGRLRGRLSRKKPPSAGSGTISGVRRLVNGLGAVVLLVGAPYYFSTQMESNFDARLRQLGQQSGVVVENVRFDRGLLSSEASNRFSIPRAKLRIDAVHRIQHGPLPLLPLIEGTGSPVPAAAVVQTTLRLQTMTGADAALAAFVKEVPPVEIATTIGFGGEGHAEVSMAGVRRQIDEDTIEWSGLSGTLDFRPDFTPSSMRFTSPSLVIGTAHGKVTISNVSLDSDMRPGAGGLMFGKTSFVVPRISAPPFLDMDNLRFDADVRPEGNNVEAEVRYSLKQARMAEASYGPGELAIVLRKLDIAALKQFEQEQNELWQRKLPDEQMQIIMMGKTMELIARLAANNPELEVTRLSFQVGDATLKGRAKFTVDAGGLDVAQNPMLLIGAVRGDAEISIPNTLLKAAVKSWIERDLAVLQAEGRLSTGDSGKLSPEALDKIAEQAYPMYLQERGFTRFLVDNGDHMSARLEVEGGRITLNGIPLGGAPR